MRGRGPVHGMVPVALLLDDELTLADFKVYTALASFQGTNDDAYPSREKIVERCGIAPETVSRAVSHLVERGWIVREQRGLGKTNVYRVLVEIDAPDVTAPSLPGSDPSSTSDVTAPSLPSTRKNFEKTTGKEQYPQDSPQVVLATLLLTEHRKIDERFLVGKDAATVQRWAVDIEKLLRLDKRTPDEVRRVILWCQSDRSRGSNGFWWASNILSGATLREKFPKLWAQSQQGPRPSSAPSRIIHQHSQLELAE